MPSRRRKNIKAWVVAGSVATAPVAIVTAALSRDLEGPAFVLTLGGGAALIAISTALQVLYQRLLKGDDGLDVHLSNSTEYLTIPSFQPFIAWVDEHVIEGQKAMLAVLENTVKWTTQRTTTFVAADPDGWRLTEHECKIGSLEEVELKRSNGKLVSQDQALMLQALDEWRKRPIPGSKYSAREKRLISEYRHSVASYVSEYRTALLTAAVNAYIQHSLGDLPITIHNNNNKPVESLRLTFMIPENIDAMTPPKRVDMVPPKRIVEFGAIDHGGMSMDDHARSIAFMYDMNTPRYDPNPLIDDYSATYYDINLTGLGKAAISPLHLLTKNDPGAVFELAWNAAATKTTPGQCSGTIRIRVSQPQTPVERIMNEIVQSFG